MPIGTYTMLKGAEPSFGEDDMTSAFYYAYGPGNTAVSKYGKISGVITLPEKVRLVGTGKGRNAFISLGVTAKNGKRGIDIGLRNRGAKDHKSGKEATDTGYGWHPYCIELDADQGYYFDGMANQNFPVQKKHIAPTSARQAKFELVPNANGKSVKFSVAWLDSKGNIIPEADHFNQEIILKDYYQWDNFCRFASLVSPDETATMTDSTYMVNGGFATLKIGSANWGITTTQVPLAWIMNEPKCKLISKWAVGESFTIDHWA